MGIRIRAYEHHDQQSLVELSLRAWEPVFVSLEQVLGDWRQGQAADVRYFRAL